ncbi:MAG: serine/threonine-protein phosphatase [Deltaproteobacteria bacterium]|nr:serine/threonine-protein phosphatase [Deltaproteobacteria bacterium]MBW2302524.1 serine/threonine-protein phosphatase [Deltaproteobacteria bacterium]
MRHHAAGKTHVGLARKTNEDSLLLAPELGLYVVADGLGGHIAGEVASRMVIETMAEYWRRVRHHEAPALQEDLGPDLPKEARHLLNSIAMSNTVVHEAQKRAEYRGMGSTVAAVLVEKDTVWLANVGDSPIYLFDQGRLIRLSEEHSVEAEETNKGMTYGLQIPSPLLKNILTRALGLKPEVQAYIQPVRPEAGDMLLICSDGLTDYVTEKDIQKTLAEEGLDPEQKVARLIDLGLEGGGGDNISVILLVILEEGKWGRFKRRFLTGTR